MPDGGPVPDGRRILVVTPFLPGALIGGANVRIYHLIRHLAQRHRVTLLAYAGGGDTERMAAPPPGCEAVHTIPWPWPPSHKRIAQARSIFSPRSFASDYWYTPGLQARLDALLRQEAFDLVQVEFGFLWRLTARGRAPVILDEHNLEYELLQRMCLTERSPLRRLYYWLEYHKLRREERALWARVDGCVFTSAREEQVAARQGLRTPTTVVPNGVDLDYFQPAPAPAGSEDLVFTGLLDYRPNTDAVLFFAREVLPRIRQVRPGARFVVVGKSAPPEISALAGPEVVITGQVPDVRPYVADSAVFVVPLRMGSGTRLKVLEALAMQKPIVSTALGCEGIEVQHERDLLVADEPDAMAGAVLRLLAEPRLAAALAAHGRQMVEAHYGWEALSRRLEAFCERVIDAFPGSSEAGSVAGRRPGRVAASSGPRGPAASFLPGSELLG